MDISLSPDEVKQLFNKLTNENIDVVNYDDIIRNQNLDIFFRNKPYIIIFYPALEQNRTIMGHYVALIRHPSTYYYFDSLAYKPDEYKKYADKFLYHERFNTLIKRFLDSGLKVDYNNRQIQSKSSSVATCGRHALYRCALWNKTSNEYIKILNDLSRQMNIDKGKKLKDNLIMSLTS